MGRVELPVSTLALTDTLTSGQAFRWQQVDGTWYGVVGDTVWRVVQARGRLIAEAEPGHINAGAVREYFGLRDDLSAILASFPPDAMLSDARKAYWGLRILQQDPWECAASFICATFKNIPAIQDMLARVARRFGEPFRAFDRPFYAFPSAPKVAQGSVSSLEGCGLGYRAPLLRAAARAVAQRPHLFAELEDMPLRDAQGQLTERKSGHGLPGVGPKVADCILLFGLHRLEAFPIDVWIGRILAKGYGPLLRAAGVAKLRSLASNAYFRLSVQLRQYFGPYAGYAQQYLYHHARMTKRLGA